MWTRRRRAWTSCGGVWYGSAWRSGGSFGGTGTPSTLTYRARSRTYWAARRARWRMPFHRRPPPYAACGRCRATATFSDDAEDAYMSGATGTITDSQRDEDYSDSPLSDDSPDALGAAAERLFARGQRISIGKDKDVRMAREMLGSGGGARARRDAGLVPADEDSSGDEEDDTAVVEAGSGGVDTRPGGGSTGAGVVQLQVRPGHEGREVIERRERRRLFVSEISPRGLDVL